MWNNLNGYIYGLRGSFVNRVMYVSAAEVREALACIDNFDCAVVVIDRECSLYDCDQTRARMGVPTSLTARLEGVFGDVEVRVAFDLGLEVPPELAVLAGQVKQAVGKRARRHRG